MAAGRPLGFDPPGCSAVRSGDRENPTVEPNISAWIGWRVAQLCPFEIFQTVWTGPEVGRRSLAVLSSIFILLTLISYTPLCSFATLA